jgi:hypothetical protein
MLISGPSAASVPQNYCRKFIGANMFTSEHSLDELPFGSIIQRFRFYHLRVRPHDGGASGSRNIKIPSSEVALALFLTSSGPMKQSEIFRENAENCLQLAERAREAPAFRRYSRMAQAWTALAEEQDWLDGEVSPCAMHREV